MAAKYPSRPGYPNKGMSRQQSEHEQNLFNIAVVGKTGCGKSYFVAAFFRHFGVDVDASLFGSGRSRIPVVHPEYPVAFWELDQDSSLDGNQLSKYDSFILCSDRDVSDYELRLHNEIAAMNKRYVYVRTKIDCALAFERECQPDDFKEDKTIKDIKEATEAFFPDTLVFTVDNHNPEEFDFTTLVELFSHIVEFSQHAYKKAEGVGSDCRRAKRPPPQPTRSPSCNDDWYKPENRSVKGTASRPTRSPNRRCDGDWYKPETRSVKETAVAAAAGVAQSVADVSGILCSNSHSSNPVLRSSTTQTVASIVNYAAGTAADTLGNRNSGGSFPGRGMRLDGGKNGCTIS